MEIAAYKINAVYLNFGLISPEWPFKNGSYRYYSSAVISRHQVTKNSSSYWEGKSDMESLQRIYAISFPDTKQMKEWKQFQEEAAKRDHRKIGRGSI